MDLMDLSGRVPPAASVPAQPGSSGRRTLVLVVLALIMTAVLARVVAERALVDGPGPWIGPLQLHLTYNSGVAFSMGNTLPRWLVIGGTSAITLLVAVYAWRSAPIMPPVGRLGLAAVLAGALSNVIDRAVDGVVTDYLHTGWFPTFNLPDVYITCGAVLIVAGALFSRPAETGADTTTNSTDDR